MAMGHLGNCRPSKRSGPTRCWASSWRTAEPLWGQRRGRVRSAIRVSRATCPTLARPRSRGRVAVNGEDTCPDRSRPSSRHPLPIPDVAKYLYIRPNGPRQTSPSRGARPVAERGEPRAAFAWLPSYLAEHVGARGRQRCRRRPIQLPSVAPRGALWPWRLYCRSALGAPSGPRVALHSRQVTTGLPMMMPMMGLGGMVGSWGMR
jgi:hypothetical protein